MYDINSIWALKPYYLSVDPWGYLVHSWDFDKSYLRDPFLRGLVGDGRGQDLGFNLGSTPILKIVWYSYITCGASLLEDYMAAVLPRPGYGFRA